MSDAIERAQRLLNGADLWDDDTIADVLTALVAEVEHLTGLGNRLADSIPTRAPNVASQPYRNGYQDCIERSRAAVDAWESR